MYQARHKRSDVAEGNTQGEGWYSPHHIKLADNASDRPMRVEDSHTVHTALPSSCVVLQEHVPIRTHSGAIAAQWGDGRLCKL